MEQCSGDLDVAAELLGIACNEAAMRRIVTDWKEGVSV